MELTKQEYTFYIKQSNDWYDKRYDIMIKLREDKLLSYDKNNEVVLDWEKANPHQQWLMRRYKDYDTYYNQLQKFLKG